MIKKDFRRLSTAIAGVGCLALLLAAGGASAQVQLKYEPVPFDCANMQAVVVQDHCELYTVDSTGHCSLLCNMSGVDNINNIGIRVTDGLLYGLELTENPPGNNGIVRMGSDCVPQPYCSPAGLPTNVRFDAGQISPDGKSMYINIAGLSPLYIVDLDTCTTTSVPLSGDTGNVHDWAYNPVDGLLYGGDNTHGQIARLNPANGARADLGLVDTGWGTLPAGVAYGGAWINSAGRLFLHRNSGEIYEIDLSVPTIVDIHVGEPWDDHNDATSCPVAECDDGVEDFYIMQDADCVLYKDLPTNLICGPIPDDEINNMGYCRADSKLYGVRLTPRGNSGIVRMDPKTCNDEALGSPAGLPTNKRFDAGDLSPDGRWMYINFAGFSPLYVVDLTGWTGSGWNLGSLTIVPITGHRGWVHDWAYNRANGLLYGGDDYGYRGATVGQLAILDPVTGVRTDTALVDTGWGTLPRGVAYGGAWFDSAGVLYLHRNNGEIYEVDISVPTITGIQFDVGSPHNDGASCVM